MPGLVTQDAATAAGFTADAGFGDDAAASKAAAGASGNPKTTSTGFEHSGWASFDDDSALPFSSTVEPVSRAFSTPAAPPPAQVFQTSFPTTFDDDSALPFPAPAETVARVASSPAPAVPPAQGFQPRFPATFIDDRIEAQEPDQERLWAPLAAAERTRCKEAFDKMANENGTGTVSGVHPRPPKNEPSVGLV
ncbi:hypothetical protein CYMTET_29542 [Cymbomonas tetramitiformis]|uniref:Uncharacterized protein n=1 Tax=Cymbomonas tetramitiformis TaxID=36881 RepID=A0AAE0FL07_9CHLO|nr:hypothetical protein CYMTET_29542 [Cymbomonas tetramitiformis]